jgi:hypothetical protein
LTRERGQTYKQKQSQAGKTQILPDVALSHHHDRNL